MQRNLVHALVITPFEASLVPNNWNAVIREDFPIHVLYCQETEELLFHSSNQKHDCETEITRLCALAQKLGIDITLTQEVIVLGDNQSEYCAEDIRCHFKN